ncbi:MAG: radical SAM protein [Sulfurovum sp. PC08-66]|nr:MAG: radical SAM protein [Sulfurovum sp. PC08-66]KIM12679.1 MAG: radical SAM protein [Sulfuricurvum sp. PC08-66]
MIHLVEHFFSIQGEGRYVGVPSLFFRLGGCNMRCVGFGTHITAPDGTTIVGCDTAYAVDKEHFASQWRAIDETQTLIDILNSYAIPYSVDVVFTGGEPLLFASELAPFVEYLVARGHRVTFETNGSVALDFDAYPAYRECTFALAVKLSNSGEPHHRRINPKAIDSMATHAREAFFKFTLQASTIEDAQAEIAPIIALAPALGVYCMPISDSKAAIEAVCLEVIAFCKMHGYTYSDRLHIRIWDAIQGV